MAYDAKINWQNNEIIETSDMNRIEQGVADIDAALQNKVDKTQIKNNLTETVAGNVLDATMGKALKELLDELRTGRGYLTTVVADGADFNTLINNGKFKVNGGTNKPDDSTSSTFLLDVTMMNSQYVYQRAACLYSNTGNTGKTYERYKLNNTWRNWVPVTDTAVQLWVGSITLSGTAQELTLLKSIATAKKVRLTFNAGAPITSIDIQPINEETVLRIGGNKYYAPVQAGATTGHIIIGFPTDTTCVVQGAVAWALSRIAGVF